MWIYGWLLLGGAAFVLVFVNLIRAAMGTHSGWQALLFASLSCGGLALLCALQAAGGWVRGWHVDELLDVGPTLVMVSSWAVCLGIVLNFLALRLCLRKDSTQEETESSGKS